MLHHIRYTPLVALGLIAMSLLPAGCGSQSGGAEQTASVTEIKPVEPQRLAYVSDREIGVVEGKRVHRIASFEMGLEGAEQIAWSGDGRQLAWVSYDEDFDSNLTMVDVESGERHTWNGVYPPIRAGTTGIVASNFDDRFRQYLPDGSTEEFTIKIPPPVDPERTEPPETYILGAVPSEGAWLVAAENGDRLAMPAGSYRIFRFDPQHPSLVPRASLDTWTEPVRVDDHRLAWIRSNFIDNCRSSDRISGYRLRAPVLPDREDERSWRIGRVVTHNGEVDVLARGTGEPHADEPGYDDECTIAERSYRWLALEDGTWILRGTGLMELDVAEDGRVARIEGEICQPYRYEADCYSRGEGDYESRRFGAAHLDFPNATRVDLPQGTRLVRFSPATAIAVRRTVGHSQPLDDDQVLGEEGFGALRFGDTAEQIQAATRTPLSFDEDRSGCGSVRLADAGAARRLGVEGELANGHLESITTTTLDVPADEERPPLSAQQPDVSAIVPRGPRTDRGLRAGDSADELLSAYGNPTETRVESATGNTVYVFEVGEKTLTAVVDGGATVRRLTLAEAEEGACER